MDHYEDVFPTPHGGFSIAMLVYRRVYWTHPLKKKMFRSLKVKQADHEAAAAEESDLPGVVDEINPSFKAMDAVFAGPKHSIKSQTRLPGDKVAGLITSKKEMVQAIHFRDGLTPALWLVYPPGK